MKIKLGDVCQVYSGGDRPEIVFEEPTGEYKIPIYGNSLENEGLYGYTKFSVINKKAITISARGSNCGVAFYRNEPYVPIVRLLSLIPDETIVNTEYLFYIIKNHPFKGSGSGQPQITIPQVANCEVEIVEDIYLQKRIAKVLSGFDLKIKNNSAINIVLEESAKTIYDYWFLQFDFPNEEGKPYKSSGGKMVWNEELQREIPEGWENGYIKDFIEICNGRDHKELEDGNIPVYGSGGIIRTVNKYLYSGESVLIPRKGTLNNVIYVNEQFWTVDTMFYSILKKVNSGFYTYYSVKLNDFEKLNTGTGVPSMTTAIIYSLKVVIPPDEVLKSFDEKMQAIYGIVKHNRAENRELGQLRDFLLPLLMNGQVGFRED